MKSRVGLTNGRRLRIYAIGCLAVLAAVGSWSFSHAQPAPSITVDAAQYAPGATVTFTATGFVCTETPVNVTLNPGGIAIGSFSAGAEGTFTGTLTAPTDPGTYELVADAQAEGCNATVTFEVVAPPTTTTAPTTTTTTTTTTATTTPPASTTTTSTTSEVTTSTAVTTTTAVIATTATSALPATGSSDRSITMVAVALSALSVGLVLLVVSRRKPS